jgi:hypothetical protein
MPDNIIERVIACWTFGKITHISHLQRETAWSPQWIDVCGDSLITLLALHSLFAKAEESEAEIMNATALPSSTVPIDFKSPPSLALQAAVSAIAPPLESPPSLVLQAAASAIAIPMEQARRRPRNMCGRCKQIGHNRRSLIFGISSTFDTLTQSARVKFRRR